MRQHGHPDAGVTNGGADGGIDVYSSTAVAQVKAQSQPIGRPDVQALRGAALSLGRQALFFSTSGFTKQAATWATGAGVGLFQIAPHSGEICAVNATARWAPPSQGWEAPDQANVPSMAQPQTPEAFRLNPALTTRENRAHFRRFASASHFGPIIGLHRYAMLATDLLVMNEVVRVAIIGKRRLKESLLVVTDLRLIVIGKSGGALWFALNDIYGATPLGRSALEFVAAGRRYRFSLDRHPVKGPAPGPDVVRLLTGRPILK